MREPGTDSAAAVGPWTSTGGRAPGPAHGAASTSGVGTAMALPLLAGLLAEERFGPRELPAEVAGHEIRGELGRGGMGVVYRALQARPRREVALKVVRPSRVCAQSWRRFEREIELHGRLSHPGIVTVLEAGVLSSGQPWFTMELVDGCCLSDHVREQRPDLAARIELVLQVAAALSYAHEHGVVHRDLTPANVLVDQAGRARVIDFGLARLHQEPDGEGGQPSSGLELAGTLPFLSPEQASGDSSRLDARTDVFGLGALLHVLLTDRPPLELQAIPRQQLLETLASVEPPPPSHWVAGLPACLDRVVMQALRRDPAERFASAGAFAEALSAARATLAGAVEPRRNSQLEAAAAASSPAHAAVAGATVGPGAGRAAARRHRARTAARLPDASATTGRGSMRLVSPRWARRPAGSWPRARALITVAVGVLLGLAGGGLLGRGAGSTGFAEQDRGFHVLQRLGRVDAGGLARHLAWMAEQCADAPSRQAECLLELGYDLQRQRRFAESEPLLARAHALLADSGDPWGEALRAGVADGLAQLGGTGDGREPPGAGAAGPVLADAGAAADAGTVAGGGPLGGDHDREGGAPADEPRLVADGGSAGGHGGGAPALEHGSAASWDPGGDEWTSPASAWLPPRSAAVRVPASTRASRLTPGSASRRSAPTPRPGPHLAPGVPQRLARALAASLLQQRALQTAASRPLDGVALARQLFALSEADLPPQTMLAVLFSAGWFGPAGPGGPGAWSPAAPHAAAPGGLMLAGGP